NLNIKLIDRDGKPAADYFVNVIGVDQQVFQAPYDPSGSVTARLRPGLKYYIVANVVTPGDGSQTLLVHPNLAFGGDSELVLDARRGTPVSVTVPNKEARSRTASAG